MADGILTDAAAVGNWVEALLDHGSGWNDLVLLAEGLRRSAPAGGGLEDLAELALALAGSRGRREETLALGASFEAASLAWGDPAEPPSPLPYPLAVARRAAPLDAAPSDVLTAFAHGFCASLVSAAVRLVPLGQSDAARLMHRLEGTIESSAARAGNSALEDLGSFVLLSEIAAMRHETLSVRLFRS